MRIVMPLHFVAALCVGCASSITSSAGGEAALAAPDAASHSAHGLTVDRPEGWAFINPDASVGPDTLVVLQGPPGEAALAPAVEISRRELSARQQRRKPSHILTQMVTEIVQMFSGFEMVGSPEDLEVAGRPAARIKLKYLESLPDGADVGRAGQFYGIVEGGQIWVIRCIGAADGGNDAAFDQIVASISIGS